MPQFTDMLLSEDREGRSDHQLNQAEFSCCTFLRAGLERDEALISPVKAQGSLVDIDREDT
jgi:hypothetical protein